MGNLFANEYDRQSPSAAYGRWQHSMDYGPAAKIPRPENSKTFQAIKAAYSAEDYEIIPIIATGKILVNNRLTGKPVVTYTGIDWNK